MAEFDPTLIDFDPDDLDGIKRAATCVNENIEEFIYEAALERKRRILERHEPH
jgi:uncharacterized protein (DUF1778 family)